MQQLRIISLPETRAKKKRRARPVTMVFIAIAGTTVARVVRVAILKMLPNNKSKEGEVTDIVEKVALALCASTLGDHAGYSPCKTSCSGCRKDATAALAVARPLIEAEVREECAKIADEHLSGADTWSIAAAIREAGSGETNA